MTRADIVVIGAGPAGLAAARAARAGGAEVLVVEARDRIGGRVATQRDPRASQPIELGAEFVHGEAPETEAAARDAGLELVEVNGADWIVTEDGLQRADSSESRLRDVLQRLDAHRRPDRSVQAFLEEQSDLRDLDRRMARRFVEGFHAADVAVASERALADAGADGALSARRIPAGYDGLLQPMAKPLNGVLRLSSVVRQIEWARGRVRVRTDRDRFLDVEAAAAVVTLPASVLAARTGIGTVRIEPGLPAKRRAASALAAGDVARLTIHLGEDIWTAAGRRLGVDPDAWPPRFLHTPNGRFNVWWTVGPGTIVAWSGGPPAGGLLAEAGAIVDSAFAELALALALPEPEVRRAVDGSWIHDWRADPFARGAYPWVRVGRDSAPATLAEPVEDTLFFAGDAVTELDALGTVEGALASGRRAGEAAVGALQS